VTIRGQSAKVEKPCAGRDVPPSMKRWIDEVIVPELVREFMADRIGVAAKADAVANSEPMTEKEQQ
jgi:hypothetical protein